MNSKPQRSLLLTTSQFRVVAAFAFAAVTLVYFSELASYSLSIDEEFRAVNPEMWRVWTGQGRWFMGVLDYVFPDKLSVIPFVPTFVFIAGLTFAGALLAVLFTRTREAAIAFAVVFVSCPVWLHLAEFSLVSWVAAIGLVLVAVASEQMRSAGFRNDMVAAGIVCLTFGIYQALPILFFTGGLVHVVQEAWLQRSAETGPSSYQVLLRRYVIVMVVGGALYYAIGWLFLHLLGTTLTYVDHYVKIGEYFHGNGAVGRALRRLAGLAFGTDATFLGLGATVMLLVWTGTLLLLRRLFDPTVDGKKKVLVSVLSIIVLLVSSSLIVLAAGDMPTRAMLSFPLLYALLVSLVFADIAKPRVLWPLLSLVLFCNVYISSALFNADRVARQRDAILGTRLLDRIEGVGRSAFGEHIPLAVVGEWKHDTVGPALRVEMFGASFFEHDGGNPYRIAYYLGLLGGQGLQGVPVTRLRDQLGDIASRPSWPAAGSVFRTDRAVVVKFGDLSYQQKLSLNLK